MTLGPTNQLEEKHYYFDHEYHIVGVQKPIAPRSPFKVVGLFNDGVSVVFLGHFDVFTNLSIDVFNSFAIEAPGIYRVDLIGIQDGTKRHRDYRHLIAESEKAAIFFACLKAVDEMGKLDLIKIKGPKIEQEEMTVKGVRVEL